MESWRKIQRQTLTDLEQLCDYLHLSQEQRAQLNGTSPFRLALPLRLAKKIEKGTLDDPILRQFVPLTKEQQQSAGFNTDPVGDSNACATKKLLHKYPGRALLVTTSACAMHCRYCFRQHFDYDTTTHGFDREVTVIANDPSLKEVILSGGDPLSLSNDTLESLILALETIPHLRRLRFHSRFPIGIPERIDEPFLSLLQKTRLQVWFVVHLNHARELDSDVIHALDQIHQLGIPILNQAVLLKGVNDDIETLTQLSEALVDAGIIPYYLHQLDRVQGAGHFEVPEKEGLSLIEALRQRLPGYAVPEYVREVAGEKSKTPLTSFDPQKSPAENPPPGPLRAFAASTND